MTGPDVAVRASASPELRRVVAYVCRPLPALLIATLVLWGSTLLLDPGGYLGTDTGGKVATLEAMAGRPVGLDPDIGHWAAPWDPSAELHGLVYTTEEGNRYVNVTTLPMVEVGAPLYRMGGYRLALLLPILGCVLAAFAARALARRLGGDERRGWLAYWVVALASPLTVYALDFWEHTLGVGLVAWGVVALLDAVEHGRWLWRAVAAGALFGAAFSMRTEALVYGFVATVAAMVWLVLGRRTGRAVGTGIAVAVGLAALVAANTWVEHLALGTSFRSERASGTASAGGSVLALRAKEAVLTAFGLESGLSATTLASAIVTCLLLVVVLALLVRRAPTRALLLAAVPLGGLILARLVTGAGFVPGMIPTTPLVALGLVVAWSLRDRAEVVFVGAVAVLSLPLVWMFQYTGGAGPQWGGRYILVSGLLLGVIGIVGLDRLPFRAAAALVGVAVVISWLGVAWLSVRSHEVAEAAHVVASLPEPVVISTEPFWLRELAVEYPGSRWLSVGTRDQLDRATEIVGQAGFDSFALLEAGPGGPPLAVPGFVATGARDEVWLDERFRISTYERAP